MDLDTNMQPDDTEAATSIQSQGRKEATDEKLQQIKEHEVNLELQAIWQMLVTGFEVTKFPTNGRPRKRIMWLTLDGKLCVGKAKSNKFAGKFIHLKDIGSVTKGQEAPQFSNPMSLRDSKGKEHLCMSIISHDKKVSFAIMFYKTTIRNVFSDKLALLITRLSCDQFGEFPKAVQVQLSHHYAAYGIVLTLKQVQEQISRSGGSLRNINEDFVTDDIPSSDEEEDG